MRQLSTEGRYPRLLKGWTIDGRNEVERIRKGVEGEVRWRDASRQTQKPTAEEGSSAAERLKWGCDPRKISK